MSLFLSSGQASTDGYYVVGRRARLLIVLQKMCNVKNVAFVVR